MDRVDRVDRVAAAHPPKTGKAGKNVGGNDGGCFAWVGAAPCLLSCDYVIPNEYLKSSSLHAMLRRSYDGSVQDDHLRCTFLLAML